MNKEKFFKDNKFLIVLDLDGTLLNQDSKISSSSFKYLQELISYGNKIVLASGRSDSNLLKFYNKLKLDTPLISYNGSKISFPGTNKKEIAYCLDKDIIFKFINHFGQDKFVNIMAEDDNNAYFKKRYELFESFFSADKKEIKIGNILENIKEDLFSFIVQSDSSKDNELLNDYLKSISDDYRLRFWYDAPLFGEFYQVGINKGSALEKVIDMLKFKKENVIAFGDGSNDAEMLETAFHSFAMVNGAKILKEKAKYTTKYSNAEDGVIKAVEGLFQVLSK